MALEAIQDTWRDIPGRYCWGRRVGASPAARDGDGRYRCGVPADRPRGHDPCAQGDGEERAGALPGEGPHPAQTLRGVAALPPLGDLVALVGGLVSPAEVSADAHRPSGRQPCWRYT